MVDVNSPSFWDEIYESGRTGWDLGQPNPVFRRVLKSGKFAPGKLLVLCAGHGYDARMFARHDYEVTALDFSPAAIQEMRNLEDPHSPLEILQTNIFEIPETMAGLYDYVLEYTCFCAIDPQRRNEYVEKIARLIKPGGTYIALAFPISAHTGGPPYAVSSDELVTPLAELGFELIIREIPRDSVPGRRGREELIILRKKK